MSAYEMLYSNFERPMPGATSQTSPAISEGPLTPNSDFSFGNTQRGMPLMAGE